MVAPRVADELVGRGGEGTVVEEIVDLEQSQVALIGTSEGRQTRQVGELEGDVTIGIAGTGVVEVTTEENGIGTLTDGVGQLGGLLVALHTVVGETQRCGGGSIGIASAHASGLEVDIEEAYLLTAYLQVGTHGLVVGAGIVIVADVADGVFAENGEVEHLVLTVVADGVGIAGEGGLDGIPAQEIVVRTFLQADDVGVLGKDFLGGGLKGLGLQLEVVGIPADKGQRGGVERGGDSLPTEEGEVSAEHGEHGQHDDGKGDAPRVELAVPGTAVVVMAVMMATTPAGGEQQDDVNEEHGDGHQRQDDEIASQRGVQPGQNDEDGGEKEEDNAQDVHKAGCSDISIVGKQLFQLVELPTGEFQVSKEIVVTVDVVEVGADKIVEIGIEQLLGHIFRTTAIVAAERHEIELELVATVAQRPIVVLLHIHVTLGMGDEGMVAFVPDFEENVVEVDGRTHIGGLDQQMVAAKAESIGVEPLLEGGIHHILGGQMEGERTMILGLELTETPLQLGSGIVEVGHDMRSEPHRGVAQLLHIVEQFEAVDHVGGAVVHAREKMAVDVGLALEDA